MQININSSVIMLSLKAIPRCRLFVGHGLSGKDYIFWRATDGHINYITAEGDVQYYCAEKDAPHFITNIRIIKTLEVGV